MFPQVTEKDVAGAVAALTAQLDEQLVEVAADPPGVPVGATVYPETALRGEVVPSATVEELVGQEVETFELTLTAEGTVVAADPSPLEEIGLARIEAEVPEGMELREGSAVVEVGEGIAQGQVIRYPVTARAEAVREIGEDEVRGPRQGHDGRGGRGRAGAVRNRRGRAVARLGDDGHDARRAPRRHDRAAATPGGDAAPTSSPGRRLRRRRRRAAPGATSSAAPGDVRPPDATPAP